jgi:hypothetical protein
MGETRNVILGNDSAWENTCRVYSILTINGNQMNGSH